MLHQRKFTTASDKRNPESARSQSSRSGGVLDYAWIRRNVPVKSLCEALGLRVYGNMVQCWRTGNHQNGDRTPSIGLSRDNRGKCFVCDDHDWSTLDLVQMVRGCDLREAAAWIAQHFDVLRLPKGKHLEHKQRWPERYRAGTSADRIMEIVICSGLWATMKHSEQKILPVIVYFRNDDDGGTTISYLGIMRYSKVKSRTTVAKALRVFERWGLLKVDRDSADGLRACNRYVLDPEDQSFLAMLAKIRERAAEEIRVERQGRAEARRVRKEAMKHKPQTVRSYTGKTLSPPRVDYGSELQSIPEWTVKLAEPEIDDSLCSGPLPEEEEMSALAT